MKSFFKVNKKDKEKLLEWLTENRDLLMERSVNRVDLANYNMELYLGVDGLDKSKHKVSVPLIYNIIEANVNQMTRLSPKVRVLPANDEYGDKGTAKVVKAIIEDVMTKEKYHAKAIDAVRQSYIAGESFIQTSFDPEAGKASPIYDKVEADFDVKVDSALKKRIGEIKLKVIPTWRILPQSKTRWEDVEHYTTYDILAVDDVVEKWNTTREKILENDTFKVTGEDGIISSKVSVLDPYSMAKKLEEDHMVVYTFFHKRTKNLPKGAFITFTDSMILENKDFPYSMESLNLIQLCDMSLPDTLHGRSRIQLVSHLQRIYNLFTKLGTKYVLNTARTKYFAPIGSIANPSSLGNNDALAFYRGGIAPQLARVPQLSGDMVGLKQDLANRMQIILGMHGISNGDIPKSLRATSSLQYLDKQEFDKASVRVKSYADMTEEVSNQIHIIAGDYYKDEDSRLISLVGKNNQSLVKHFKAAILSKPYNIKFEGTDGFPETTAAKRDRILEAMQMNPTAVSGERWLKWLEVGDMDKLVEVTGAAIDSAESENEDLMVNSTVFPPESWEDHVAHLEVHYPFIQTRDFKEYASNEVMAKTLAHIQIHELFLLDIAMYNPQVSAKLATIPLFPITESAREKAAEVVKSQAQQQAVVQGQTNRGEPVTEQISGNKPGEDENVG